MTSRNVKGRVRRALVLATVATLAIPHLAAAHAELVRANPADGETVTRPVIAVTGRYSENLDSASRLVIKDAIGATVGEGGVDPEDTRRMFALVSPALREGRFTVESTTISSEDGDLARLTWTFTVAVPSSASPTSEPSRSAGSTATAVPSPPPTTSPSPSASPAPSDASSGGGDVLLPILAALAIVLVGTGYLLDRSRSRP